jgi:hypothetical protein
MIESPSAKGYLKISLYASLATFAALGVLLLVVFYKPTPAQRPIPAISSCRARNAVNTSAWVEIPAAHEGTLRVPPDLKQIEAPPSVGDSTTHWKSARGSLTVSITIARRSEPRWHSVATFSGLPLRGRGEALCPRDTIGGRLASVETTYWSRDGGDGYVEVYAEIQSDSDRVVRVDVTSYDLEDQKVGLAIVRSMRFVMPPTN